jgi:hypothetical protein
MALLFQDKDYFRILIDYNDLFQDDYTDKGYEAAFRSVQQAKTWGLVSIGENFTTDLMLR